MESDYLDVTTDRQLHGRIGPLAYRRPVAVLEGRFCFRIGHGFGCGSSGGFHRGQKTTLSLGISGPLQAATLSGTVAVEHSFDEDWSHDSRDCEYCRPTACYRGATVEIWEHSYLVLGGWKWSVLKTKFQCDQPPDIYANCVPSPDDCNCLQGDPLTSSDGTKIPVAAHATVPSAVIQTVSIDADSYMQPSDVGLPIASVIEDLVDDDLREANLGILGDGGRVLWLPGKEPREPTLDGLVMFSSGLPPLASEPSLRRPLLVLAVAPELESPHALLTLTAMSGSQHPTSTEVAEATVVKSRGSWIWAPISVPIASTLEDTFVLQIALFDGDRLAATYARTFHATAVDSAGVASPQH
ncbi:MAG TPA: hypothetical protein VJT78_00355 [Candidatus Dormibacteraeota bacterium]|nr:hypothetical protein [Candidatus Dormibacteraeota bacterium]